MNILYVFLGAGIGGVCRYLIFLMASKVNCQLPVGTMVVNIVGCFLAGVVLFFALSNLLAQTVSIFLVIGILGGFTTFSAFSIETCMLFRDGQIFLALCNIFISLGNIVVTYIGYLFMQKIFNIFTMMR